MKLVFRTIKIIAAASLALAGLFDVIIVLTLFVIMPKARQVRCMCARRAGGRVGGRVDGRGAARRSWLDGQHSTACCTPGPALAKEKAAPTTD